MILLRTTIAGVHFCITSMAFVNLKAIHLVLALTHIVVSNFIRALSGLLHLLPRIIFVLVFFLLLSIFVFFILIFFKILLFYLLLLILLFRLPPPIIVFISPSFITWYIHPRIFIFLIITPILFFRLRWPF